MLKKVLLSLFLVSFLFTGLTLAQSLVIYTPNDGAVVNDEYYILKGRAEGLKKILVNNFPMKIEEDGTFSCQLILTGGKNLVVVDGYTENNERFSKVLRIL
ncbi:MAG: hypothetical protein KKA19_05775, partial [Candidatus Margulisbacteria bacterium]|nr:hypothetical protein [Candidatus Margulisiibacteriota bacterium]